MMTVKQLKELLRNFKDDDIFCVYDMQKSERYLPNAGDFDLNDTGYFEVNIDEDNLCS